jgi:tetratricopeptide (TPR) repeat protein
MAASTVWIRLLFQQGAVTAEDYLGEARSKAPRRPPSEELTATFRDYADRAAALVDKRLRERPLDADSHFEAGSIAGVQASYTATIEGRMLGAVSAARRAYNEHKRCMELDSSRKDAGLIVGSYRYAVSTLPASFRVLAHIAGFSSGRDEGLRLVEEAAAYEDDPQPDALFALVVIYSREGRHADALRAIRKLQAAYPRNRLLWLEAGASALRAGRPGDALAALDEGLAKFARDPRPRAFGEEARWRYYRGTALAGLHQVDAAERELRSVLSGDAHEWIRGRAHVEIGKLADLSGRRSEALAEYRLALSACRADRDTMCLDDARRFTKTVYREEKGTNR